MFSKEPYTFSREPYMFSKEPYMFSKEPYIFSKEPYISSEESNTFVHHTNTATHRDDACVCAAARMKHVRMYLKKNPIYSGKSRAHFQKSSVYAQIMYRQYILF